MQELIMTKKSKKKVRRIRQKNEKKWVIYQVLVWTFFILCAISIVVGLFFIDSMEDSLFDMCARTFSITLVGGVVTKALLTKASSHWIQDRLNERVWIEDGMLYHFLQTSFAAGLNSYNADERGYVFIMDISTIREAKYDEKSRRIEFIAEGRGMHYSDVRRKIVDREWPLQGYSAIFYDSMRPSLYESLIEQGVSFEVGTIEYKFSNKL